MSYSRRVGDCHWMALFLSACLYLAISPKTLGQPNTPQGRLPESQKTNQDQSESASKVRAAFKAADQQANGDPAVYLHVLQNSLALLDEAGELTKAATQVSKSIETFAIGPASRVTTNTTHRTQTSTISQEFIRSLKRFGSRSGIMIIGGIPTPVDEFDSCVAIGGTLDWCGTGILVSSNVVITAAHCHPSCTRRIFVGKNVNAPGEILEVKVAVQHPQYNVVTKSNDIAVLILKNFASARPTPIAAESILNSADSLRLVGFGMTNSSGTSGYGIQRMVDVPPIPNSCLVADQHIEYGCNIGIEIVAGAPLLKRDACRGDSGGPAFIQANGKWYVGGITSRKTVNAPVLCGNFSAYVRLHAYLPWIREVAAKYGGLPPVMEHTNPNFPTQ